MFLSILNNCAEISISNKFLKNTEKYRSIKFESYSSTNVKQEYDNGEIIVFFKGVIYNFDKLQEWFNTNDKSRIRTYPDILVNIYKRYGFEYMLSVVDGIFSLILLDQRTIYQESRIYVSRDLFGITPLYTMTPLINESFDKTRNTYRYLSQLSMIDVKQNPFIRGFSTDYNALSEWRDELNKGLNTQYYEIHKLPLGCYHKYTVSNKVSCVWEVHTAPITTYRFGGYCSISSSQTKQKIEENVRHLIYNSIEKRLKITNNTDIVCVIDPYKFESILIACLVNQYMTMSNCNNNNNLNIYFMECSDYTLYLQGVLNSTKSVFLSKDATVTDYFQQKTDDRKMIYFSCLFLNINDGPKCEKSLMDIDKELNDSLSFIQNEVNHNIEYDTEYPLLDAIWLKYYLSIDLSCRSFLIQTAFNYYQFEGKCGLYTLE